MTPAAVLRRARDLIADEKRWNTVDPAVDASGKACDPLDPNAARWCAIGALIRVDVGAFDEARRALLLAIDDKYVGEWNDAHTHAEVTAAFDRAIDLADPPRWVVRGDARVYLRHAAEGWWGIGQRAALRFATLAAARAAARKHGGRVVRLTRGAK